MMASKMNVVFALSWSFVILVSVLDGYLLLYTRDVIGDSERNPVGLALLAINGGQVWLFLLLKLIGTVLVSMWLLVIHRKNPRRGLMIVIPIACFQLGLLIFLGYA